MKKYILIICFFMLSVSYSQSKKPNIVIIISDDHAYQTISAYNKNVPYINTPNIDRIANEGMLFKRAYVNNSICGPSRACLLTGKTSNKNGYKDNENSSYDSSQQQFVNLLQDNGYQTAWIGKYHLGHNPKGFDFYKILVGQGHYFNPDFITAQGQHREEGYVADLVENSAEKWLDERDKDKPFCLIIGHKNTHRTWMPDLQDLGKYDNVRFKVPNTFFDDYRTRKEATLQEMSIFKDMRMAYDLKMINDNEKDGNFTRMTPAQRQAYNKYYYPIKAEFDKNKPQGRNLALWKFNRYMNDYLSTAVSLDRNIGRTLDYLDRNNLSDNTIVIYTSDQGFYMGEHGWFDKRWMYEESFRTPFIIKYPKLIQPKTETKSFMMNIDIAPTLLQLAGVKVPQDMQGKSFVSILKNPNATTQSAIYYHYYENGEHAVSPHFGVRTDRFKLIKYYKRGSNWELFDLKKDPHELNNVYKDPRYTKIRKSMHDLLVKKIKYYEDQDALNILSAESELLKD